MGLWFGSRGTFALTALAASIAVGCDTETTPYGDNNSVLTGDGSVWPDSGYSSTGDSGWPSSLPDGQVPYEIPEGGYSTPDIVGDGTGTALPPAICKIVQSNGCLGCHGRPTSSGATMSLTLASDFGNGVGQKVLARMSDLLSPMPPRSTGRGIVPFVEQGMVKSWIDSGAKGVQGEECKPPTGPDIGPQGVPDWAKAPWPTDCDYVMTMGAHGSTTTPFKKDNSGFPIPTGETSYECFYEKVEYTEPVQVVAVRAKIESPADKELVHHLVISGLEAELLGQTQQSVAGASPNNPGDHKHCDNPSGSTIGIWAPGGQNPISYPSDVGIRAPKPGSYIEMQVHYNNPMHKGGQQSRVQYDLCLTKKRRPNEAGVFWLGFENANAQTLLPGANNAIRLDNQWLTNPGTAIGKCSVKQKGRILWMAPHMHELGRHTKMEVVRKNGTTQTILDEPFDFTDQVAYYRDNLWVEQGDSIRSTCKWDTSRGIHFGFGSKDEMCFIYTAVYPIEALKASLGFGLFGEAGFVGGELSCAAQAGP